MSDSKRDFGKMVSTILGSGGRAQAVRRMAGIAFGKTMLSFPSGLAGAKRALCVMPESKFDSLYLIDTLIAIIASPIEELVLLCENECAQVFEHLDGLEEILGYSRDTRFLFSREQKHLCRRVRQGRFDLCILMDRNPDIAIQHVVAKSGAPIRVGFKGSCPYPILNVQLQNSSGGAHITNMNMLIAKTLGAAPKGHTQWKVAKATTEEITHLVREFSIPENAHLAGIDASLLFEQFDREWARTLLDKITAIDGFSWYLYADHSPEGSFLHWLDGRHQPLFADLSLSRAAALIRKSALIVSGKSITFELAHMLKIPAVGIFEENERVLYCRPKSKATCVNYAGKADRETIEKVIDSIVAVSK